MDLRRAIGCADLCELLAAAFAFPGDELVRALVDGSFEADARCCLADAGGDSSEVEKLASLVSGFSSCGFDDVLESMKKGYSVLFLGPGDERLVWPYESAFRFAADGKKGAPVLFRSPVTLDVESQMREASALPDDSRQIPCDNVSAELSFLSTCYTHWAQALFDESAEDAALWSARTGAFLDEHAKAWFPAFFEAVVEEAAELPYGCEYVLLALFCSSAFRVVCSVE